MLSDEKHCEFLTQHIRDRTKRIVDSFKLFVQMFAALVGGSAAIRLQYPKIPNSFAWLADGLGALIFIVTTYLIVENLNAWSRYRTRLSEVAGRDENLKPIIPPPMSWRTARIEMVMVGVMFISMVVYWVFNPLQSSN